MMDIIWLRPLWMIALPCVAVIMMWTLRQNERPGDWNRQIDPDLLAAMISMGRLEPSAGRFARLLPHFVAAVIAIALIGPAVERRNAATFRNLNGVVFVIDVSGSMVRDPSWAATVNMAQGALGVLGSRPAALIVYGGDSYLAEPLTTDHLQLGQTISLIDPDLMPDRGNRPHLGLEHALSVIEQANLLSSDVILMTDGYGLNDLSIQAAQKIADANGQLSVVRSVTQISGAPVVVQDVFETIVDVGRGRLYETNDIVAFREDLRDMRGSDLALRDLRLNLRADLGRYLLLIALFPAVLLFQRTRG
ncbi:vWA domain-containing protein [Loktanella sp. S4079]|uniref:vWA domain-containing protein n=1 Tax=Loktanella sp. S4079 TaxID=579483 RepID=UPI0005FA898E|nr:vWA domain-containing protein [Loktanella sp. S4079]KJZ18209.1 hypothetical protein TW80_14810 [Loktanella sp. S4079]